MRQSDITPGVYESKDGMMRTVVEVIRAGEERTAVRGNTVEVLTATCDFVRFHYYRRVGQIHEVPLRNFARWAARRMQLAQTPAVREATASCALDGETQVVEKALEVKRDGEV